MHHGEGNKLPNRLICKLTTLAQATDLTTISVVNPYLGHNRTKVHHSTRLDERIMIFLNLGSAATDCEEVMSQKLKSDFLVIGLASEIKENCSLSQHVILSEIAVL